MYRCCIALFVAASCAALVSLTAPSCAQEAEPVVLNDAERAFAEAMTGATLVGSFTLGDVNPKEPPKLYVERYELGGVTKLSNGQWRMQTRIRYGDKDLQLPLMVPIEWVGAEGPHPTPIVVIDNLFFPGAGTYSARVLFHEGHYAGHWSGKEHGGVLFGKIVKAKDAKY